MLRENDMIKVCVLHGINLNMFGKRDPSHYGTATLADIDAALTSLAAELGLECDFYQSNHEGQFVEKIHSLVDSDVKGVIANLGAWTHYNYAVMDALAMLTIPIVEVHMSNIHAREEFRHFSILAAIAKGSVAGFGVDSYLLGLRALAALVKKH